MQETNTVAGRPEPAGDEYLTAETAIDNAPKDLIETDVEGVFGGKVRIRGLSAAQQSRVKQASLKMNQRGADVSWAEMERLQFQLGVIKPTFTAEQVKTLHIKSGPSFQKVIEKLDAISGTNKEALRQAQEEFQGRED